MVFIHLGDLHIGKHLGDFSLKEDQKFILKEILDIAKEKKADAIVIAGDVYDQKIPAEGAVELLDAFLADCVKAGLQVFMISGNHDSDERLNFGSGLFSASGIHICGKYDGELKKVTVTDAYGEVDLWLLPFVKASQVRHFFPEADIPDYDAAVRQAIVAGQVDPARRNVILAHQYVAGSGSGPIWGGSESQAAQNVGTVEVVSADCFRGFDYTALGHIHSAQNVDGDRIRYCGSPLKYSKSEVNSPKSVTLVTLAEKGSVTVEEVPLKPLRDVRIIRGRDTDLLHPDNITDPDDFIFATLTNEEPIPNAMALFQSRYPNTVSIAYERDDYYAEDTSLFQTGEDRSFMELAEDFFSDVYKLELTEDQLAILKDAAKEAGLYYEAD